MRVAFISYPMLLQRYGGLQVQMVESLKALNEMGFDVSLFDWRSDQISDFDLIHIFAANNSNHRIVEAAKAVGVPVVMSTVVHPPFPARYRLASEWLGKILGRLTDYSVTTSYQQIRAGVSTTNEIIVNGETEREMMVDHFGASADRISIIPNAVGRRFFDATPELFDEKFGISHPFVVCSASVSPLKNQLTIAKALQGTGIGIVLVGNCHKQYESYLEECKTVGGDNLHYLGAFAFDDPVLPSLYAAADALVLPSLSEVMPFAMLECLAAGTPTIVTKHQSVDLEQRPNLFEVIDPHDVSGLREMTERFVAKPASVETCREFVASFTWENVAAQIREVYRRIKPDL
jgi:glycosyltransferase involved in cell wall biosynthesis